MEADENGLLQIEDRVFELEDGRILSVSQGPQEFNGNHYFLKDGKIYWSESEGSGTMLRQSGERTDSFCIVGQTLYYSAYMGTNEIGLGTSRIYRIDLETMEAVSYTHLRCVNLIQQGSAVPYNWFYQ